MINRSDSGVWMMNGDSYESAARHLAIRTMIELDLDPNDFRVRDRIIKATCDTLHAMLDEAASVGRPKKPADAIRYLPPKELCDKTRLKIMEELCENYRLDSIHVGYALAQQQRINAELRAENALLRTRLK